MSRSNYHSFQKKKKSWKDPGTESSGGVYRSLRDVLLRPNSMAGDTSAHSYLERISEFNLEKEKNIHPSIKSFFLQPHRRPCFRHSRQMRGKIRSGQEVHWFHHCLCDRMWGHLHPCLPENTSISMGQLLRISRWMEDDSQNSAPILGWWVAKIWLEGRLRDFTRNTGHHAWL